MEIGVLIVQNKQTLGTDITNVMTDKMNIIYASFVFANLFKVLLYINP